MDYSRYIVIAIVPFLAAAVMPWVAPDAVARVLLVTLGWTALTVVFIAGLCVGDALAAPVDKARLSVLSALGCCALSILALGAYRIVSPLMALALMTVAFFLAMKLVQATGVWQRLNSQKMIFYRKLIWMVLGCLLMLCLSYYRELIVR
ncbi:hypothetical protein [Marinagarivorans algicola]|uniref:hypothetical protein n=1 Tax=Marinagarivorans algicola TaxID=1513270 RepID=UPI0006B62FEF|nr:hypothetical protein [Marinagarivorans algicola]